MLCLELLVQRDDEEVRAIGMSQTHVVSALTSDRPADPLEGTNELLAGNDRQSPAYNWIGILLRTTPAPIGRPSSRRPSI